MYIWWKHGEVKECRTEKQYHITEKMRIGDKPDHAGTGGALLQLSITSWV